MVVEGFWIAAELVGIFAKVFGVGSKAVSVAVNKMIKGEKGQ